MLFEFTLSSHEPNTGNLGFLFGPLSANGGPKLASIYSWAVKAEETNICNFVPTCNTATCEK